MIVSTGDIQRWILKSGSLAKSKESSVIVKIVQSRGYSRVFKAQIPGFSNPIAIKVYVDPDRQILVEREFEALSRVWRKSERYCTFRSLRPHPFLLDQGCLVTDWLPGNTMTKTWAWFGRGRSGMAEDAAEAGKWLRNFHGAGRRGCGVLDSQGMIERLLVLLGEANATFQRSAVVTHAIELLTKTAEEAAKDKFPVSWLHGDFKAANVLLVHGEAVGIDIQLDKTGVGLHDAANFLVDLNLLSLEPWSLRLLLARRSVADAFLAGYLSSRWRVSRLTLLWMQLHLTMIIWAARAHEPKQDPRSRFLRARLRLVTRRLLRELSVEHAGTSSAVLRNRF